VIFGASCSSRSLVSHTLSRLALVVAVLLAATPSAAADWVRVDTPNFVVYGETGGRRVREVAGEFERFRQALARVIPAAATPAAVPTVVVVFNSHRSFDPYAPRYNGKPVRLGGYFFASDDMNIVALADADRDESRRTIFHEYVHLVLDNVSRGMPLWLNEGLAEYYSTFRIQDRGTRAIVGALIPPHLQVLNSRRLMTAMELLAVDRDSPAYNEGQRQSLFYAQSWALVHMLVSGSPNRAPLLARYARLVSEGTASPDAWRQVFGDQNISSELERYVAQDVLTGVEYRFGERIDMAATAAVTVAESDVQAVLGDLLRRVAPAQEAAARFDAAVALQPPSARARALYGLLLLEESNPARARALLLEASRDTRDWLVQYHAATGLTRFLSASDDADPELVAAARAAIDRVRTARPDLANVYALDARLQTAADEEPAGALESIRRARAISPGREDYALLESFILMRLGQFAAARALASPLTRPSSSAAVRANARDILAQIDTLEQVALDYIAKLEGRPLADATVAGAGRFALRKLQPGEQRTEGSLERIDCTERGVVFEVSVAGAAEWFGAPSLSGVSLITHRDDLRGAVTCGPRATPERVYLTSTPAEPPSTMRRAVAVEFLPK
jgi:hypothetical protein